MWDVAAGSMHIVGLVDGSGLSPSIVFAGKLGSGSEDSKSQATAGRQNGLPMGNKSAIKLGQGVKPQTALQVWCIMTRVQCIFTVTRGTCRIQRSFYFKAFHGTLKTGHKNGWVVHKICIGI